MRILHKIGLAVGIGMLIGRRTAIAQQLGEPLVREAADSERAQLCRQLGQRAIGEATDSLPAVLDALDVCSSTGPAVAATLLMQTGNRTTLEEHALYGLASAFRDERVLAALGKVAVDAGRSESERIRALKSLVIYIDPSLVVDDRPGSTGRWRFSFGYVDHPRSHIGDQAPTGPLVRRVGAVFFEVAQQAGRGSGIGRAARDLLEQLRVRDATALDIPAGMVTIGRRCGGGYILTSTLPVMVSVDLRSGPNSGSHPVQLMPEGKTVILTAGPGARSVYTGTRLLATMPSGDGCVTDAP